MRSCANCFAWIQIHHLQRQTGLKQCCVLIHRSFLLKFDYITEADIVFTSFNFQTYLKQILSTGLYKQLSVLKDLLTEYRENPKGNFALAKPILEARDLAGLQEDCPYSDADKVTEEGDLPETFQDYASELYQYLQV